MEGDWSAAVLVQFVDQAGEAIGKPMQYSINVTKEELGGTCLVLLNESPDIPYSLFVNGQEIVGTLLSSLQGSALEEIVTVKFQRQAQFRVNAVTRNSGDLPGHTEAVVCAAFSQDSLYLATGSGDTTVRLWDVGGVYCLRICQGHKNWVLCVSWAPDTVRLASGCRSGSIIIWDPTTAQPVRTLNGHRDWITSLSWEPLHRSAPVRRLASSSKDTTIRIWDTVSGHTLVILSGHSLCVTTVRWGGIGFLYSGSQDRTVRVWKDKDGSLYKTLNGHAHWVNMLALSTDGALINGVFNPLANYSTMSLEEKVNLAKQRFERLYKNVGERVVSGSDDKTAIMWNPECHGNPITRLTGHQQSINDIAFSPDGKYIATASFDRSIKLWNGMDAKFISTFRGHVQAVYKISWSPDRQYLVSCSADSTVKVWRVETCKMERDLPGHADEVYAVDWSPDGEYVASAGKDRVVKIWHY
ncbi:notchless protein homolog 1 [Anabrus simplex]|uniref:notchless protein homolog 1 n=1 Tax=Anabrus simplex TaxID=316456 RepID=UPI0035A2DEC4